MLNTVPQPRKRSLIEVLSQAPLNLYGLTLTSIRHLRDGKQESYKVLHDIWYHVDTPDSLISVLDGLYRSQIRVRLFFGDLATGRDWGEEYGVMGTIARSCDDIMIPQLIASSRSHGGVRIRTNRILKITTSKRGELIWKAPNYQDPEYEIAELGEKGFAGTPEYPVSVLRVQDDGSHAAVAHFPSLIGAKGFITFMKGETNSRAYNMRVAR